VRHGFFAVHILARAHGVYDDLFVPVVGYSNQDGVDRIVIQQLLVASGRLDGFTDNFTRQFMSAIVKIASGYAFDAGQLNGSCQQLGAFHANPYNAKANLSLAVFNRGKAINGSGSNRMEAPASEAPAIPALLCKNSRRE